LLLSHVSIQICSFVAPCRRPILIATPLNQSRTWCTSVDVDKPHLPVFSRKSIFKREKSLLRCNVRIPAPFRLHFSLSSFEVLVPLWLLAVAMPWEVASIVPSSSPTISPLSIEDALEGSQMERLNIFSSRSQR